MTTREFYISVDVETDGPIPSVNSMLGIGAVAFDTHEKLLSRFAVNLLPLENAVQNPATMLWWERHLIAWSYLQKNCVPADKAMADFHHWIMTISKQEDAKPVCVCYPSGFDFTFIYWYLMRFTEHSPFGFQCIDLKTLAYAALGKSFKDVSKRNMPLKWSLGNRKHSHIAVEDAEEQGYLFFAIRNEIENMRY